MNERTCEICGTPLSGRATRYCSRACAIRGNTIARAADPERMVRHCANKARWQRENREKARGYVASRVETRTCEWCGKTWQTRQDTPSRVCSHACAQHKEGSACHAEWVACDACGRRYLKRNTRALTGCSPTCRTGLITGEWPKSRLLIRECPVCGTLFRQSNYNKGITSACSHKCRAVLLFGAQEDRAPRHWAISGKRRLRIYERDNWTCLICGEPVDRDANVMYDDWAPSLDHITPRSKGGHDSDANLRCAHRWCNSVIGDGSCWTADHLRTA